MDTFSSFVSLYNFENITEKPLLENIEQIYYLSQFLCVTLRLGEISNLKKSYNFLKQ